MVEIRLKRDMTREEMTQAANHLRSVARDLETQIQDLEYVENYESKYKQYEDTYWVLKEGDSDTTSKRVDYVHVIKVEDGRGSITVDMISYSRGDMDVTFERKKPYFWDILNGNAQPITKVEWERVKMVAIAKIGRF